MSVPLLMMNNSGDILQRTYIAMLPEIESTVSQCVASHKYLNLCTWYSDSWPREWIETHPARTQTCSPLSSPLDAPTTLLHSLFHYGRHITNNYRNFFKVKQDTDSRSFIHSMLVLSSFYDCPCVCYFISILIKVCRYVMCFREHRQLCVMSLISYGRYSTHTSDWTFSSFKIIVMYIMFIHFEK